MAVYLVTLDSDPRSSAHRLVHYDTLSLNHHLYADDIQLSFFFIICFFYSNITGLQDALQ